MADEQFKLMERTLKLLQIPDAIKDIPPYSGSRTELSKFITQVEDILKILKPAFTEPQYQIILLRAIRNKIVGEANKALEMYNTTNEWESIKSSLIAHFADKRDENSLIRDLHAITQRNDNVEVYFTRILEICNTLKTWANLNTPTEAIQKAKWYDSMCLSVFTANLRDSLGIMVRAMQPPDLPTARLYCLKEQNIAYMKNKSSAPPIPLKNQYPQYNRNQFPQYRPQNFNQQYYNNNKPQYFNHRPFTQQKIQQLGNPRGLPPKPIQNNRPEPMDTTSNIDKYKQPTFQRPFNPTNQPYRFNTNGPSRVQVKELYNIASNPYHYESDSYYPNEHFQCQELDNSFEEQKTGMNEYYEEYLQSNQQERIPTIEIQDEDFCQPASENLHMDT